MIRMIEKMRISPPILLPREVRFRGGVATTTLRACGTATYTRTKSPPHTEFTEGETHARRGTDNNWVLWRQRLKIAIFYTCDDESTLAQ